MPGRTFCALASVVFLGLLLAPAGARAQSSWRSRLSLTIDARGEVGPNDVAGIDLGLLGAGVEWKATPTFRLRAEALLLGATGSTETGRSASGGAGGELSARVIPFPGWRLRPYLRGSTGMLLFLRQPFLPGGDVYEFILQLGAGLEVTVNDRLSLFAELHATHLSNGQGLGPFNPAFTGEGGLVGAAYALAPPDSAADAAAESPAESAVDEARPNWSLGATFDAEAGSADGTLEIAGRDRVAQRLTRHGLGLLEIESGDVDGHHLVEAGIDLAGHWTAASAGLYSAYRNLDGVDTFIEQLQVEANLSPEASLVAMGDWEIARPAPDGYRAALILRLYPIETFVIELGGGYNRIAGAGFRNGFTPAFALEWQLPFRRSTWQVSVFVERQVQDVQLAGLGFSWDMGSTLRDIDRRTGWRRLR
jgi:hypothetical protein